MNSYIQEVVEPVQKILISWFKDNGRDLPWRKAYDPYCIWISEIMLQQTQMDRGVEYYTRWMNRFPDIAAVAEAQEDEILKLWEGLGYYARARNLHAAAKQLMAEHEGVMPCNPKELLSLPGIGPYTAGAISSIACNTDISAVDANVIRVYSRIFDIDTPVKESKTKKNIENIAIQLLPAGQARVFNQALMDFGGMICRPRQPLCGECPISSLCRANSRGTVEDRPILDKAKKTLVIEMATGMLEEEGRLFIQQRKSDDIWGGLWEFPGGRLEDGEAAEEAVVREYREETGFTVNVCKKITTVTHFYTRYKVILHCFSCKLGSRSPLPELTAAQQYKWVFPEEIKAYGFPAGHRKLLEYIDANCPELLNDPCR